MWLLPLVLVGFLVIFGLFFIVVYNGLVRLRNEVKNSWSQIDVQLKRRHDLIPNLVNFLGDVRRIRIRFDPIVHVRLTDGSVYTNLPRFVDVVKAVRSAGGKDITISWMDLYAKVRNRLNKAGIEPICLSEEEWKEDWNWKDSDPRRRPGSRLELHWHASSQRTSRPIVDEQGPLLGNSPPRFP